jgi:hypothetical protein
MKPATLLLLVLVMSCGGDEAEVESCEPENACSCTDGVDRETACVCAGGASCSISGDNIEFSCDGNADCNLACGDDCLITCPGTTTCTVDVGDNAVISCPGTASCDVLCQGDCEVDVGGNADAIVTCVDEANGAICEITGCSATSCGDGVYACGVGCPTVSVR